MISLCEGEVFGKLRVVSDLTNRYMCECQCGQYCEVPPDELLTGQAKHCGLCEESSSTAVVKWITTD